MREELLPGFFNSKQRVCAAAGLGQIIQQALGDGTTLSLRSGTDASTCECVCVCAWIWVDGGVGMFMLFWYWFQREGTPRQGQRRRFAGFALKAGGKAIN